MILAIDSGNTSSKIGIFNNGKLDKIIEKRSYHDLIKAIISLNPENVIIGTVHHPVSDLKKDLSGIPVFDVTCRTPMPVSIKYKTPETLGIDRIAASVGAWERFPGENILVIDAGTCITYDLITCSGHHLGGGISPGPELRFRSLHQYTAGLPLVHFSDKAALIGNSTENSILSGVINGTLAEMEGIIYRYRQEYPDIKVVLCGGFTKFFESKLKDRIFAFPDLVVSGLFSIFRYNVE